MMINLKTIPKWFIMEHDDDHEGDYHDIDKYFKYITKPHGIYNHVMLSSRNRWICLLFVSFYLS